MSLGVRYTVAAVRRTIMIGAGGKATKPRRLQCVRRRRNGRWAPSGVEYVGHLLDVAALCCAVDERQRD